MVETTGRVFFWGAFLAVFLTAGGCRKKPEAVGKPDGPVSEVLKGLTNRTSNGKTDFVRSFSDSELPWQLWEPELLGKAEAAAVPIFALVGSPEERGSGRVARELAGSKRLREELSENFLCTVVDVRQCPEVGLLAYFLAAEVEQTPRLPMMMWLSPKGYPLAWTTVDVENPGTVESLALNSVIMIRDTWDEARAYALRNSEANHEGRLKRLNYLWTREVEKPARLEVFPDMSREFLSLYNPIGLAFDGGGAGLPSGEIDLASLLVRHPMLAKSMRQDAEEALRGLLDGVIHSSLHDPVDGGFFQGRRLGEKLMPDHTKTLGSQARFAAALFRAVPTLETSVEAETAMELLKAVEREMLGSAEISVLAPPDDWFRDGLFLWSVDELKMVLTPEELTFVKEAYGVQELGNSRLELGEGRDFLRLNSLVGGRRLSEIAPALGVDLSEAEKTAESALRKLEVARESAGGDFFRETAIPAETRAAVVRMYAAAAGQVPGALEKALGQGELLRSGYRDADGHFLRLPQPGELARGADYGESIHAGLALYGLTLDRKWLEWTVKLAESALTELRNEEGGFREAPARVQTIPGGVADLGMEGDSSLGLLEAGLGRLQALTGREDFRAARDEIWKAMFPTRTENFMGKVDFLEGSALGDEPLVAALSVDPETPGGKEFLKLLNGGFYSRVVVVAKAADVDVGQAAPAPAVLLKGGEPLGSAETAEEFREMIDAELEGGK